MNGMLIDVSERLTKLIIEPALLHQGQADCLNSEVNF
jgi:hypothetical protein